MGFFFKSKGNNLSTLASVAQIATSIGLHYEPALEEADAEYAQSGPDRKKHHTCCHNCYNSCPVWVYTEDGVAVKIEGDENGTLSKGLSARSASISSTWYIARGISITP